MRRALGRVLDRFFPAGAALAAHVRILVRGHGFPRSARLRRPVDGEGAAIPWYTYPAIEYLGQFNFRGRHVFEYGTGYSTAYWVSRGAVVHGVESDTAWRAEVLARSPSARIALCAEPQAYARAIADAGCAFDVVAIDGRWRRRCAAQAARHTASHGIIILDNGDRHPEAAAELRAAGLFQVDFSGFGPVNGYAWTTSFFLRAPLELQSGFEPPRPVGGLGERAPED